jgi:hypothetical protein
MNLTFVMHVTHHSLEIKANASTPSKYNVYSTFILYICQCQFLHHIQLVDRQRPDKEHNGGLFVNLMSVITNQYGLSNILPFRLLHLYFLLVTSTSQTPGGSFVKESKPWWQTIVVYNHHHPSIFISYSATKSTTSSHRMYHFPLLIFAMVGQLV